VEQQPLPQSTLDVAAQCQAKGFCSEGQGCVNLLQHMRQTVESVSHPLEEWGGGSGLDAVTQTSCAGSQIT